MKLTKCCGTCINDLAFAGLNGCSESEQEAYQNKGYDCEMHLFADDETLMFRYGVLDTKCMYKLECSKCRFCVINGGVCDGRIINCMAFKEVKE